ncbi:MAG: sodium:solute symporter family protein [Planctomycetota bacterium]
MSEPNQLASGIVIASIVYAVCLVVIGALAHRARRGETLADHFLAGRSLGFAVLLFTLFATQYSGNSLSAFPGKTYRDGLSYFMTVPFMVGIVTGYLLFAPKLFALARDHSFLTPTDFLTHRFQCPLLSRVATTIFALVLCNFLLAQLMALGHAVSGLTEGQIPYGTGVVAGGAVILVYEVLGGMRAVAWTDALQGAILAFGLLAVVLLLFDVVGTPGEVIEKIEVMAPTKASAPSAETCGTWLSTFLLLGLGAPLYPQAIQRIYAARRLSELRRALATMAFLPLIAVTTVVFIGAVGITMFPGLDKVESDRVTFLVLAKLVELREAAFYPVLLVMMAVLAAIMSTADSCLLSLASVLTRDVSSRDAGHEPPLGRALITSVAVMIVLVSVALLENITLWRLLELKFEVLIQLSPAFVLGTSHDREDPERYTGRDILVGLGVGLTIALGLRFLDMSQVFGIHAGVWGVAPNYLATVIHRRWRLGRAPQGEAPTRA